VTDIAYWNGVEIPATEARLPVTDLGVVGGLAVSEMLRTFRHDPFRVAEHLARLSQSLELTGLAPRVTMVELEAALRRVVAHNTARIAPQVDVGVIVFVTAGPNPTYVGQAPAREAGCTVVIHTFALQTAAWTAWYEAGVSLRTSPVPALPTSIVDRRVKSRSRMGWHQAQRAVATIEPAALAIVLDEDGTLTETAAANLVLRRGTDIASPPAGRVLEGVSLGMTLELAARRGYRVTRRPITPEEAYVADELWLTTTPACLIPVTRYDGRAIGAGVPGAGFRDLLADWSAAVGVELRV
jgi:branched-subunit amino acid aminotransferase/4-amino-4-deoxychorismate lyase